MKKVLLSGVAVMALIIGLQGAVKAQSKTVTVNVDLKEVNGLIDPNVGTNGADQVNFSYASASDYSGDKIQLIPNQIGAISTSANGYTLTVKAEKEFTSTGSAAITKGFTLNMMNVKVRKAGDVAFSDGSFKPTLVVQTIYSSKVATPAAGQSFDIQYTIPKNDELLKVDKSTYTTTLIYSMTAK